MAAEIQWAGIWCLPGFPFTEEFCMARDVIREAIEEHLAAHAKHCTAAGFTAAPMTAEAMESKWNQVVEAARAKGINWTSLLALIGPILNMIAGGNPIVAIIAQILAILNPPAPVPPAPATN